MQAIQNSCNHLSASTEDVCSFELFLLSGHREVKFFSVFFFLNDIASFFFLISPYYLMKHCVKKTFSTKK